MIYITELIYVYPGKETVFSEFESVAIPIIRNYNGQLLLRLRPDQNNVVEQHIETPYEIHLVQFDTEEDLDNYGKDAERAKFLHLKEQSIKSVKLIKGRMV